MAIMTFVAIKLNEQIQRPHIKIYMVRIPAIHDNVPKNIIFPKPILKHTI